MKNKKFALGVLIFAVILNITSYVLRHPYEFGFCEKAFLFNDRVSCVDSVDVIYGEPLQVYSFSLILISIILLFVDNKVFTSWFKFGIAWSIAILSVVSITPNYGQGIISFQKDTVSMFMSVLFVLISSILIIYKSRKLRHSEGK